MPNLNKVMLMGNLTRDVEVKYTPKGTAIAAFGIAINRHYTTEAGEKREEVTFVDIEAYARMAELMGEYMSKGKPIYIEGRLKLDTWDDKETGKKRSKMKVVMDSFQFIGGKREEDGEEQESGKPTPHRPAPAPAPARRPPPAPDPDLDAEPDDIPF